MNEKKTNEQNEQTKKFWKRKKEGISTKENQNEKKCWSKTQTSVLLVSFLFS
jgi:hypothetical protein